MKATRATMILSGLTVRLSHTSATSMRSRQYYPGMDCAYPGYSLHDSFAASEAGTYVGCSDACLSYPECKSFAFDSSTSKDCQLYNYTVDENLDLEYSSYYYFYDITCQTEKSCGYPGDDYRWRPFDYSNGVSEKQCTDRCLQFSNCRSYAYGNKECFIYDTIVKGNLNGRNNSPYLFSDRSCISANGVSSSTTSTGKKTTSAATSKMTATTSSAKVSTTPSSAGKSSTTSTASRTSTSSVKTSSSSITTAKTTSTTKGDATTSSLSRQSSNTSTRVLSTSVTISNQAYFCTAVN